MTLFLLFVLGAPPQEAEKQVREALGALEKALAAPDESLGDHFDLSRLVKEMERRGAIPDVQDEGRFRYRSAGRLGQNLAGMAAAPGALRGGWESIQPLGVRLNAAGDEAEALCRVAIGGRKSRFRFWLIREGNTWRTFDLENLDGSFRLSVIGLQYTPGVRDDDDRYALRDGVMSLQRGAVHLAQGQPEATREAMDMARRAGPPEYVMAWIDLVDGQALSALGEPEAALKAAARVLARQKDLAQAHRLKAVCHAALGEHEKAIAAAKEYLKLVGDEAQAWTLIGKSHERLDQTDPAIEAFRKGAECDSEDYRSRLELGRVLLHRHPADEARPHLAAAARLAPVQEKVFESVADLLDREGAHAAALEISEEAASRRPDDPAVLLRRGRALRKLGRSAKAEELIGSAATLEPGDPEIGREFILALAQAGKDAEALERVKAGAKMVDGYIRAFVHAAAGRSAQALEALKPALLEEWNLVALLARIEAEPVFVKLREGEEGRTLLEPARATRDYWKARQDLKLTPEELHRMAVERIKAVPDHSLAYADQGHALRKLQRYPEAERAIRKAIEMSPDKTLHQDELGRTLAAQGKLEEALDVADFLLKARPKSEQSGLDLRVAVYAIAGERERAVKALHELLGKHPDWHSAVTPGEDLDGFRKLPAVQELIRKARAKGLK